jgi:hypothetical protein
MPTIHEKLKLAYVSLHPDDGLMLTVTTARGNQKFDMQLSPKMTAMLLNQLTEGARNALRDMDEWPS